MKHIILSTLFIALLFSCGSTQEGSGSAEEYFFVTRLGNDTLAIERIQPKKNGIEADVVLRSPNISLRSYSVTWNNQGKLSEMTIKELENQFGDNPELVQEIKAIGDSLVTEYQSRNGVISSAILNDKNYLPFIDMVHWPYDVAFKRAAKIENDSIHQYLLTGRRASDFIIHRTANEEYTLRHPSRGVMYVQTNENGNMTWLDAKETTRKLIVERVPDLNFEALTQKYIAIDKEGSPFGTLSPAEEAEYSFGGADFRVTYGSPQKRGRKIFGGIVTYGERWRTGANAATHFSTSKDIFISGNRVPAGEYTIFTIPEERGGTLIINQQTGQNGRSYDETRDLMRVPMMRDSNTQTIEGFMVQVVETDQGGSLELLWDETIYYVDFTFN